MDYAWGANGLDAIITQVFLRNIFECFKLINVLIQKIFLSLFILIYFIFFILFFYCMQYYAYNKKLIYLFSNFFCLVYSY